MPKMIFRGSKIRYFGGRQNDEGGNFIRIHFSADFSEPIRAAMGWGEVQDGATKTDLEGSLTASSLILSPNGAELKQHELQLSAQEVTGFRFVRGKTTEDGKVKEDRLDFVVVTVESGAGGKVEEYIRVIGKGAGQLRIGYEEQAEIELNAAADETQERLISEEQARDTAELEESLEDLGKRVGGIVEVPPLASAVGMGGSHQKGTKREQRKRNPEAEAFADGSAEG